MGERGRREDAPVRPSRGQPQASRPAPGTGGVEADLKAGPCLSRRLWMPPVLEARLALPLATGRPTVFSLAQGRF
jgi:hypothetical protein